MPTYEYRCDGCEQEFTVEQRITAEPLDTCPDCGASDVRRLISRSSFVLKGSGFYTNDYARKGQVSEKKSESPACASCDAAGSCGAAA